MASYCKSFVYDDHGYPVHAMNDDVRREIAPMVNVGQLRHVEEAHASFFNRQARDTKAARPQLRVVASNGPKLS